MDLALRSRQPELMDAGGSDFATFRDCLRDLERINVWSLGYRPTLAWLAGAVKRSAPVSPISILDVGFGHGDMLRRLWRWAERRNVVAELAGIDINPWARRAAQQATSSRYPIRYETADLFEYTDRPHGQHYDFIISALFTHHLSDHELLRFIRWMDGNAVRGWFINDIHRHALPYGFVKHFVRVMRLNPMVIHDAPLSVARAFTRQDWRVLLTRAGVAQRAQIQWWLPFRYGVGCLK